MSDNEKMRLPARGSIATAAAPKERAETRPEIDATIMAAIENETEGNKYFFDKNNQPDDMTYEFKRFSVAGQEDRPYQMELKRKGWSFVPAERHPECGTEDPEGKNIMIGGLVLMERNVAYTNKSREMTTQRNRQQVGGQFERLQIAGSEHMPRKVTALKQTYEAGQDIPA